jgi:hypothetical protein
MLLRNIIEVLLFLIDSKEIKWRKAIIQRRSKNNNNRRT